MNGGAMLNAYPDSLGGTLSDIAQLLESEAFADAFRSFYILPSVFNTDLDRGFSVISYDLNRMLAAPEDVKRLKENGIYIEPPVRAFAAVSGYFKKRRRIAVSRFFH